MVQETRFSNSSQEMDIKNDIPIPAHQYLKKELELDFIFEEIINFNYSIAVDYLAMGFEEDMDFAMGYAKQFLILLNSAINWAEDLDLRNKLEVIKGKIITNNSRKTSEEQILDLFWSNSSISSCLEELKDIMREYRNTKHKWEFSFLQLECIKHYYYASKLLIKCLKNVRKISNKTRQEIYTSILLPIAKVENYKDKK
ncbi:NACHT C-terminal helical domain 2-containing protein [Aulosira sp. FACHB-615]|uniref:NACHT C-terminal helical domain 2-containing protein n=1 Tax=Aulosira sp. FACHB-615 TaxID=2692777 RepID=UPI001689C896|nr:hypothetical protein [Aulosira sp. FACHB-615]MBD2491359.1 hypothetical protein [Aulosira sp. FACHB-615]